MAKYNLKTQTLLDAAAEAGDQSLYRISKRTGIDLTVLSRVTRHQNGPQLDTVVRLAQAYGLTVEALITAACPLHPRRADQRR